jgi:ATP synthase protein I
MDKPDSQNDKLAELSKRIETAKNNGKYKTEKSENHKNASIAWRMVIELVIGMIIGFALGYGIDYIFNTAPLMIIIMSLFGFGAGIRTMMKTATELK